MPLLAFSNKCKLQIFTFHFDRVKFLCVFILTQIEGCGQIFTDDFYRPHEMFIVHRDRKKTKSLTSERSNDQWQNLTCNSIARSQSLFKSL